MPDIRINKDLVIPEKEIKFSFARSRGPGGQNVNKVNTKVVLRFDVNGSKALSTAQKKRLRQKMASRISRNGVLVLSASSQRSQHANRQAVVRRFAELLSEALKEKPPRKKTKVSKAAKERRLKEKKHLSALKKMRAKKLDWD